jgi:hypothetical protein
MMLYRQFATQEEIDKEYDVEKSVPDFQRYAEFNTMKARRHATNLSAFSTCHSDRRSKRHSTSSRLKIPTRLFSFLSTAGTGVRTAVKNSAGLRGDRSRSASRW